MGMSTKNHLRSYGRAVCFVAVAEFRTMTGGLVYFGPGAIGSYDGAMVFYGGTVGIIVDDIASRCGCSHDWRQAGKTSKCNEHGLEHGRIELG